jgi:hypothetical protein
MTELIRPDVTGYLVHDVAQAVGAVGAARSLDRAACRAEAIARFSSDRMVDDYERLFDQVVHGTA